MALLCIRGVGFHLLAAGVSNLLRAMSFRKFLPGHILR